MTDTADYAVTMGFSSAFGGLMHANACDLARYIEAESAGCWILRLSSSVCKPKTSLPGFVPDVVPS